MAVGEGEQQPLHILFFPFIAHGHLIPVADMAALFAARGVRCTILTTPVNAAVIRSAVDRANDASRGTGSPEISITLFPFPDVGLPPGVESAPGISSKAEQEKIAEAFLRFREPFDRFLAEHHTDAVVVDSFFHWSSDAAADHGVPRLAFLGSSLFARACSDSMLRHNPVEASPDDPDAVVLVLNHPAVGVFVTHCGWNSVLEAVSAGVPMVAWPRFTDQFYNEKLIVEILKVGVGVGAREFASFIDHRSQVIAGEVIAEAIGRVMGEGEEGEAMRKKVKELSEKARSAVKEGGSSYDDAGRLLDELMARRSSGTS
uniref:UDP-glycosyltransferases domain-containing protein n=1 Tax=Oryza barthii TaxID=65489 RepID=A0A0D3ERN8_9ORYZ